ncbi:hypothetical protein BBAD15_g8477 [Beauveria bassiana D1-5]|uniref:Uncharacterized protein n=1 Tax=Beauveria bassiana D1-5 TaxID=1245745 RepID=A0A0A2VJC3_BEABA|nr:hypothetical protein BBAD15_g8477 [Beauveria bassiana D1-5]
MAEIVSESSPLTGVVLPRKPTIVRRVFRVLIPSFVANYFHPAQDEEGVAAPPKPLFPTSYLNSLRGIASLIVVFQHNSSEYFESNYRGWGDQADDHYIIQLPFIRVLVSGGFMVAIFFVSVASVLLMGRLRGYTAATQTRPSEAYRQASFDGLFAFFCQRCRLS